MRRKSPSWRNRRTAPPPRIDVLPERVVIDRELRSMLERDGFDLHGIAERLIAEVWYHNPGVSQVKIAFELVRTTSSSSARKVSTLP